MTLLNITDAERAEIRNSQIATQQKLYAEAAANAPQKSEVFNRVAPYNAELQAELTAIRRQQEAEQSDQSIFSSEFERQVYIATKIEKAKRAGAAAKATEGNTADVIDLDSRRPKDFVGPELPADPEERTATFG